jgi:hypothetical protein
VTDTPTDMASPFQFTRLERALLRASRWLNRLSDNLVDLSRRRLIAELDLRYGVEHDQGTAPIELEP